MFIFAVPPSVNFLNGLTDIFSFNAPSFEFMGGLSGITDVLNDVDDFGQYLSQIKPACLLALLKLALLDNLDVRLHPFATTNENLVKKHCPGKRLSPTFQA